VHYLQQRLLEQLALYLPAIRAAIDGLNEVRQRSAQAPAPNDDVAGSGPDLLS
jgi:hypothetical protein